MPSTLENKNYLEKPDTSEAFTRAENIMRDFAAKIFRQWKLLGLGAISNFATSISVNGKYVQKYEEDGEEFPMDDFFKQMLAEQNNWNVEFALPEEKNPKLRVSCNTPQGLSFMAFFKLNPDKNMGGNPVQSHTVNLNQQETTSFKLLLKRARLENAQDEKQKLPLEIKNSLGNKDLLGLCRDVRDWIVNTFSTAANRFSIKHLMKKI